jgi:hypothetical protein
MFCETETISIGCDLAKYLGAEAWNPQHARIVARRIALCTPPHTLLTHSR